MTRLPSLDIRPRLDAGEVAELSEANVGACSTAKEDRVVRMRIFRHDALNVRVNDTVHRPEKRLAPLHSAIEQPSPT